MSGPSLLSSRDPGPVAAAAGAGSGALAADGTGPRPRRRTQAERREQAERRLLDAALAVVARRGSVRMTLAEVGEAAGYSRGLPAHRFGSKAGLLRALAAHIGELFRSQREAGPQRAKGELAIPYSSIGDAKLVLTDALIEDDLKRRKQAGKPA
jgi:AcrR family transcriptional regulator